MSQTDLENFQRLEEFPSFVSCIRSFGRSIIPPLLTSSQVHELRQLRAAAISKETGLLKRRKDHLREIKDDHALSMLLDNDPKSGFQSSVPESCALWYPSYLDNQDVSVAISKFPTSGIYSSVHTDAIVCSNEVGSNHAYNSNIAKNVLIDSGANIADCIECSHSNVNLECSLCLAEWNQNLCSKSFPADLSPEVPCRTFSLLQHNDASAMERESIATVEEVDCESLPTVICNQKNVQPDTDTESNATCMTQSTDLEKYMEFSCEFNSPDNSAVIWDSKTASQQCTLSRSDDASSETIVNTENELTPCASTMAELTDNIEDEFSTAEEVAGTSDNKEMITGSMKRAHSVDSYMKMLQKCGKNQNVKKSQSEPFNTIKITNSVDISAVKTTIASKTSLLIKEDSKESEEAKDVPEKDNSAKENVVEVSTKDEMSTESDINKNNSFHKKHVRQNSYTLDHPSSALVLAHADCSCNFDAKCISPHCSALKSATDITCNSAFVKEKVGNSASPPQMKLLPILNSDKPIKDVKLAKEEMPPAVVDIFPEVNEDNYEKSDSDIKKISINAFNSKLDALGYLSKSFLEDLNLSNRAIHQEYIERICEELKASHELRVKELRDEQNRQWLKLEQEFQDQEKFLYEKLRLALESSRVPGLSSTDENNLMNSNLNSYNGKKMAEEKSLLHNELPTSKSSGSLSDQIPTYDSSSSTQTSTLSIPTKCSPSSLSPPETTVLPEDALFPSKECLSPDKNASVLSEDEFKTQQLLMKQTSVSVVNLKHNEDPLCITSESTSDINGFSPPTSFVPHYDSLPKYPSAIAVPIYNDCDKIATCFCDNNFELCRGYTSSNGCSECDINSLSLRKQNSTSFNNNAASKKLSPSSGIQKKSMDSAAFSNSVIHAANFSRKSNECIPTMQSDILISTENRELLNVNQDDKRNSLPLPMIEKANLPVGTLVYGKASKNGTCSPHDPASKDSVNRNSALMKKFKKLPAFVKGYLTRRLLKTEYVQNLIKTFKDTALLIGKMGDDLPAEEDSVSRGDVDFQRQLIVLLMTTYENFYDTFFSISTKERMSIIADSRHFRLRQKNSVKEQESNLPLTSKVPEPSACKTYKLSSATLKVLERKKRPIDSRTYNVEDLRKARSKSVLDMKTYTIDDLPSFSGRAQSSMSSKGVSISPSSIYKNSMGTSLKRKTASAKPSGSRGCIHQKWVP